MPPGSLLSHLCPAQAHVKAVEIPQTFAGEAGAAVEAGDVSQRREVVVQQRSLPCVHVQRTVTETSCVGLKGEVSVSAHMALWVKKPHVSMYPTITENI